MPFSANATKLLNEVIFVVPIQGYGWQRIDDDRSLSDVGSVSFPPQFRLRLLDFFFVGETPTVACGTILERQHQLNNWWVAIIPMVDDTHADLVTEASSCGTLICLA